MDRERTQLEAYRGWQVWFTLTPWGYSVPDEQYTAIRGDAKLTAKTLDSLRSQIDEAATNQPRMVRG